MNTLRTSEVLNTAADLIEERGWVQGNEGMWSSVASPLCLEGAIGAAMGLPAPRKHAGMPCYDYEETQACAAGSAVRDYLGIRKPWLWNDAPNRTAAEVIEVLRAVAVIEAARETEAADHLYALTAADRIEARL